MKKLILAALLVTGCAANMDATPTELMAVGGLQGKLHEVELAIGQVSTDRSTQNKILGIAFALVEVERAERSLSEAAAKARGLDVALVLSGTKWQKQEK